MFIPLMRVPLRHARRRQPPSCAAAWLALCITSVPGWAQPAGGGLPALSYAQALEMARQGAPSLRAQQAALDASASALPAAATLPDPRLTVGLENLPVAGADRWSTTRDPALMQRLSLMQDVPNHASRQARAQAAQARVERDRAALALADLSVRREAALAWMAVYFAEARKGLVGELLQENRLLMGTMPARIASGAAPLADLAAARQEALAIADRADDLERDVRQARAALRRWVGAAAEAPLGGAPATVAVDGLTLRGETARYAELLPFAPLRALAQAELAEADAGTRGDWAWEVAYSRRPRYDDMVSVQLSFDLPWQRERRQQPLVEARRRELERIDAERDDVLRRQAAQAEAMLADLRALDAQAARLAGAGQPLAAERVALALAAYGAGRGDLGAVLAARSQALETRLRAIDLDAQRAALRVRLSTLIAE